MAAKKINREHSWKPVLEAKKQKTPRQVMESVNKAKTAISVAYKNGGWDAAHEAFIAEKLRIKKWQFGGELSWKKTEAAIAEVQKLMKEIAKKAEESGEIKYDLSWMQRTGPEVTKQS